jgi:hypothetical protein
VASDLHIDGLCEQLLLSQGRSDEAYTRYGLSANQAGTYLAWFRVVQRKYAGRFSSPAKTVTHSANVRLNAQRIVTRS